MKNGSVKTAKLSFAFRSHELVDLLKDEVFRFEIAYLHCIEYYGFISDTPCHSE